MTACLVLAPSAAAAQAGVLVRVGSGEVECASGSPQTHVGVACASVACDAGRHCVELPGVGVRCIDPREEIVCVEGAGGCEQCPLDATSGADPEACAVITLPAGAYSLCIYDPRWVCLGEEALEPARCLSGERVSLGDCDADGVPNGEDGCVCAPGSDRGCPALDAGGSLDAGARGPDASRGDAEAPVDVVFRGGGGCACAIGRPAGGEGRAMLSWLALALSIARTRARRRPLVPGA